MDYEYDPWFLDQTGKEGCNILLWEVGLNAGQLFFAQIEAFEKIFNQPSGFYTYLSGDVILHQPAYLKALIEAMLDYYNATRHPLRPILFDSSIQILLVLYQRAMGEWLPAPAALMATIEQIEIAMGRGYLKRNN
ncbi:DUF6086 family protein [Herpetosiphon giganteus]|uniref:DUF6086 family protein n=1 Tax=Herpetosiphon giganteus TaxID=2029754 RepID=UPI001959E93E|nr:DUF6086 family protein [Herpetosiphon giganteus]MBM7841594.1 hypothetical protein [Herpetosiphon giganteus]